MQQFEEISSENLIRNCPRSSQENFQKIFLWGFAKEEEIKTLRKLPKITQWSFQKSKFSNTLPKKLPKDF